MTRRIHRGVAAAGAGLVLALVGAAGAVASGWIDVGVRQESRLARHADAVYGGIGRPLAGTAPTVAFAKGRDSVALASGLRVERVLAGETSGAPTAKLAQNADQIALWPRDTDPQWAILCIEDGTTAPGIQRLKLRGPGKGRVETLLTGTAGCDGIRRTPWNTILATEETGDGWALELYDPIGTTGVAFDRTTGALTGADAGNVHPRPALGRFAWEGLHVLADGTVFAGDELRPSGGRNGGALFTFVSSQQPGTLDASRRALLADPANAARSPLAAGALYALRVGDGSSYGQGNQTGRGTWVGPLADVGGLTGGVGNARLEGQAKGTGFYRPEDLHADPIALARGDVRICWTNTGVSSLANWGEVLCLDDRPDAAASTGATPEVQPFVLGNPELNQPDNIAFQPRTGILYVIEDTPTIDGASMPGDVWACLRDGDDANLQSDGCVRVASVRTAGAEPTGLTFDGTGERAYLNIQHSPDDPSTAIDEGTFDELLVIGGFNPRAARAAR